MRRCCLIPYVLSICAQNRCAPSIQCPKSILCISPDLADEFHLKSVKFFVNFHNCGVYRIDSIYFFLRYVFTNSFHHLTSLLPQSDLSRLYCFLSFLFLNYSIKYITYSHFMFYFYTHISHYSPNIFFANIYFFYYI